MTTRLEVTLKREISVDGEPYTVTLTTAGLKLVPKGRRKGLELQWKDLLSGEHALAVALNATLDSLPERAGGGRSPVRGLHTGQQQSAKSGRKGSPARKRRSRVVGTP